MRVDAFDFILPESLIASRPAFPRETARLLEVLPSGILNDKTIQDFPGLLLPSDILVFNNTAVIPANLSGTTPTGKKVAITLHHRLNEKCWLAFAKPAKKLKIGSSYPIAQDFSAKVIDKTQDGVTLEFNVSGEALTACIEKHGSIPLPPYITKKRKHDQQDHSDYQTIYAQEKGAVAAPTAGLHFTEDLFANIEKTGAKKVFITLHVGAGTFLPVKSEYIAHHHMHTEYFHINEQVAQDLNQAKKKGSRIIAIGTTSLRALEAAADDQGILKPASGHTDIFITPGYQFKIVDALLTNFHLPKSTLFMLVSALAGMERMQAAYAHAIAKQFRFYSYGDACFIHKALI